MTLKRTYKRDKRSGRMIETTPDNVKALLPNRRRKPGVPMISHARWPIVSSVLGVSASKAEAYNAFARAMGTGVSYAPDGTITIPDKAAMDRHLKAHGQHNDTVNGE
jgi:hypothetical protein